MVIVASAIPSAAAAGVAPGGGGGSGAGSGAGGGGTRAGAGGAPATSGSAGGPAAARIGALPGTYPIHQTSQSNLGSPYDGDGSLSVGALSGDRTQADSATRSNGAAGGGLVLGYDTGGEVTLVSITSPQGSGPANCSLDLSFSPPLELVPSHLAGGVTWSGSINAGGLSGSYSGSVAGQGSDTVGGVAVPVWKLHGAVSLSGRVCSHDVVAKITLDSDWASSVQLSVAGTTATDATIDGAIHLTSTTGITLLRTTPGG